MSRLITISVIIVLILGLSFTGISYAHDTKRDFEEMISAAQEFCAAEDRQALSASARSMQSSWEEREGFLSFYVRHDEIEKMATYLVGLEAYAKTGSFDSAAVTLYQMAFLVNHIYHRELPNLDNLF